MKPGRTVKKPTAGSGGVKKSALRAALKKTRMHAAKHRPNSTTRQVSHGKKRPRREFHDPYDEGHEERMTNQRSKKMPFVMSKPIFTGKDAKTRMEELGSRMGDMAGPLISALFEAAPAAPPPTQASTNKKRYRFQDDEQNERTSRNAFAHLESDDDDHGESKRVQEWKMMAPILPPTLEIQHASSSSSSIIAPAIFSHEAASEALKKQTSMFAPATLQLSTTAQQRPLFAPAIFVSSSSSSTNKNIPPSAADDDNDDDDL